MYTISRLLYWMIERNLICDNFLLPILSERVKHIEGLPTLL